MKMINSSDHPLTVPGELLDNRAYPAPPFGKPLVKPARVTIPVGAVVEIDPAFALPCRRGGAEWTSVAHDLTGGALRPHGPDAMREAKLFTDQHAEIQLRQIEHRDRMMRENPQLYPAADLASSMQTEHERIATMLGLAQMQTLRETHEPEAARPVFETSKPEPEDQI